MPDELLEWNEELKRWEYSDTRRSLWMSNETLKAYVQAWHILHNVNKPTRKQQSEAYAHCLRVATYLYIADPDVHIKIYSIRPL